MAIGLAPPGYGADCSVPCTKVVSSSWLNQYQRVPSGDAVQNETPLAIVARLASLPIVCIFRISGPEAVARADQAMVSLPGTGNPTRKCRTAVSAARLTEITVSTFTSGGLAASSI